MLRTVEDFLEYMNQLYDLAMQNGLRNIVINTGPDTIIPEQIFTSWRTPNHEDYVAELVGINCYDHIYIVRW